MTKKRYEKEIAEICKRLERLEKEVQGMPEPLTSEWMQVPGVENLSARYHGGCLEFRYFYKDSSISVIAPGEIPSLIAFLQEFNARIAGGA